MAAHRSAPPGPSLTPAEAVDRLDELHTAALGAVRGVLARFLDDGSPSDAAERARFHEPELRITSNGITRTQPQRAWAMLQVPGA